MTRDDNTLERREPIARRAGTGRRALLLGLSAAAVGVATRTVLAAPSARLIEERWGRFGADAIGPDNTHWAEFLEQFRVVDADGVARLRYAAAAKASGAMERLDGYLAQLQAARPMVMSRDVAFAYWCNLYNALTVRRVLAAYPVSSIREIGGGFFSAGPWREDLAVVEGEALSLDDIEHGVLRPAFRDPRVHYALNCASVGCPNLDAKPFAPETLGASLDRAARAFVNSPRGLRFEGERLIVSSIYHWFREDFEAQEGGLFGHLRAFAAPALAKRLAGRERYDDHAYDWSLNNAA